MTQAEIKTKMDTLLMASHNISDLMTTIGSAIRHVRFKECSHPYAKDAGEVLGIPVKWCPDCQGYLFWSEEANDFTMR